jgi:hypothetical protein
MTDSRGLAEAGYFDCAGGGQVVAKSRPSRVQTNDVCSDERGLIHIIDRVRGMHIVERA